MNIAQKQLQSARIIHIAFVFAAVSYAAIPFMIAPLSPHAVAWPVILIFGVLALSTWMAGLFIRNRMVGPVAEALRGNPEDASAAARWRTGTILSLTFCEVILLLGFALKFQGAPWNICVVFYAVGIFFLLLWAPRLELPPS